MNTKNETPHIPDWIPWEKILIWSLFFLFIYVVRDFFFVIFMTFILAYSMRGLVVYLARKITPKISPKISHPLFSVICFLLLIFSTYRIGAYIFPEFISQGQSLTKRIANPKKTPKAKFDELLAGSIGQYLFNQKYGEPGSEAYITALNSPSRKDKSYEIFKDIQEELQEDFERTLLNGDLADDSIEQDRKLQEWVFRVKAPALLNQNRGKYVNEWETFYRQQEFQIPGLMPLSSLDSQQREEAILRYIASSLVSNNESRQEIEREWQSSAAKKIAIQLKKDNPNLYQEKFRQFFLDFKEQKADQLPYSFEDFEKLKLAALQSPTDFLETLAKITPTPVSIEDSYERKKIEFEKEEKARLVTEWKKGDIAAKLESKLEETIVATMGTIGKQIGEFIPRLVLLPVQLILALMLSFFIVIDVPRMKAGIERLKHSRAKHFYKEIAPGLISFGKLMGRAFQAQAVIAIINTLLTLAAIKVLGIQNAAFLSVVVFICSFIPVLGVVLSGIPICMMAIIQDGGSFFLAFWAIAAILIVHFIETSILNPKIVGDIMHLHPVLVLAILAVGEHFFGVWGLLLGTPVVVYIIRFVILDEGIPGLIEPIRKV